MTNLGVLVDAQALAAVADDVLVVDCRFALADPGKGARDFAEAHIPRAVYASLDHDLSDLSQHGLGRHPLPDVATFARTLARLGWRRGRHVVAYDAAGGALAAARLWWMLGVVGIGASVLNGGWQAWLAADLPVAHGAASDATGEPAALQLDKSRVVYFDELETLRQRPTTVMLDARAAPRFRGEVEPLDRVAGHIPGARNRPFAENLRDGRFKDPATLRGEFERVLAGHTAPDVVHMCGSGVTACHNLLAMEAAGLHGSRLFAPSWSGWSSDPARPVATGA